MSTRTTPRAAAAALLGCALLALAGCKRASAFGADFEGEITLRTTRPGAAPTDMVVDAKGDKLRFESTAPNGKPSVAIYDPASNKVSLVMDSEKAYMDMDFSSPTAGAPNTDSRTSTVDKTGKHETIAGYDCEDWVARDPSGKRSEVCIAEGLAFFDLDTVRHGGGPTWNKEAHEKKVFPLRSVEYDASGKETSRTEVTRIERTKLDDARFAVPKGYARVAAPAAPPSR